MLKFMFVLWPQDAFHSFQDVEVKALVMMRVHVSAGVDQQNQLPIYKINIMHV